MVNTTATVPNKVAVSERSKKCHLYLTVSTFLLLRSLFIREKWDRKCRGESWKISWWSRMSTLQKIHQVRAWNVVGGPLQTEMKSCIKTNTSMIRRHPKNGIMTGWSKSLSFGWEMQIVANKNVRIWQDLANCWAINSCFVSYKAFQEMWQILKKGEKACTAHRNLLPSHGPAKRKKSKKKNKAKKKKHKSHACARLTISFSKHTS